MNATARLIHAMICQQELPNTSELTAMERAIVAELHPLLESGPCDVSDTTPARGWTIGVVADPDRAVA